MEPILNAVTAMPTKKRFGLIAARIGRSFAHKISVPMPLEEGEYSTVTKTVGSRESARTRVGVGRSVFEFGTNRLGERVAIKALPGATVYLEVQDLSRLEADLTGQVKWTCTHPECRGAKFDSKEQLHQAHAADRELVEAAEKSPVGQAHVYYGVLELPAVAEKRDDKTGKVTTAAQAPTIMLVSDEA